MRKTTAGRLRRFAFPATAALVVIAAAACTGDTLYEAPRDLSDVDPPQVLILEPGTDATLQAGRPVRVLVTAVDSLGVAEIELEYTGVLTGSSLFTFVPPRITATVDTVLQLPAGAGGKLRIRATSRNVLGAEGITEALRVPVSIGDTVAPIVAVEPATAPRIELTDSIRATVRARDNNGGSGLVEVGLTLLAIRDGTDTLIVERRMGLGAPRSGTVTVAFAFAPPVGVETLPANLELEYHAFAVDSAGNCAGARGPLEQRLRCLELVDASGPHTIVGGIAMPEEAVVVAGRSVSLPAGSSIPDAVVDRGRSRMYLSNLGRNRIEILDLATLRLLNPVSVGSQPWGVHVNRSGDSLIVANSGGTSISYVTLNGTPTEAVGRRLNTPNTVLFVIHRSFDQAGFERLDVSFTDFSDRPQFMAQDFMGRLLYSTLPTGAAPDGTIRMAEIQPGWQQPEVRLLLSDLITKVDTSRFSVAHVDSMRVLTRINGDDLIEIYDHRPGFPNTIVRSGFVPLATALQVMTDTVDSDIRWDAGDLDLEVVGLSDTTFVAASGDRRRIAFGEGATAVGRVIMWDAVRSTISNEITIADLVGNTAERIHGLDLNLDGTLNTARGTQAAYFFKQDLRLQGHTASQLGQGAGGSVLHPQHPSYATLPPSGANTLAFVAGGTTIRIFDTVHFVERGTIEVRDNISGPLRVSQPLPGENAGCTGSQCIVAKLYGVTDGGAVVIVDVRGRDISN